MNLDKRHLVASIALLVAAVSYNIWVFTRPADGAPTPVAVAPPPVEPGTAPTSGAGSAGPIDPSQVRELPDVALGRLPQWPRDPFASLRPRVEVPVVVPEAPLPAPEPEPLVASILYSPDRRLAMIDGRVARIGDVVGSHKIIDILPNAVVVESKVAGRRTVTLKPSGAAAR